VKLSVGISGIEIDIFTGDCVEIKNFSLLRTTNATIWTSIAGDDSVPISERDEVGNVARD
jgi:hypothetical protein